MKTTDPDQGIFPDFPTGITITSVPVDYRQPTNGDKMHHKTAGSETVCPHCEKFHTGKCPNVKSIEYFENGYVKKVEYFHPDMESLRNGDKDAYSYWNR